MASERLPPREREAKRTQPRLTWILAAAAAGLGSGLAILILATVDTRLSPVVLVPSFGASCALIFGLPQSPFAQPLNVIGGHLISSGFGLLSLMVLGAGPAAMGLGVGLAIAGMMITGTMHPPAGGDPIIVILAGASASFLLAPMLIGTALLVLIGAIFHSVRGVEYPVGRLWFKARSRFKDEGSEGA